MATGFDQTPLRCSRCARTVHPGRGDHYLVRIEAVADPAPPVITEEDLAIDLEAEFARLVEATRDLTARQAMDQVHRRVELTLCLACYRDWIEDPASSRAAE
jgi:hypothetical protein